jgi:hypothetical protein
MLFLTASAAGFYRARYRSKKEFAIFGFQGLSGEGKSGLDDLVAHGIAYQLADGV